MSLEREEQIAAFLNAHDIQEYSLNSVPGGANNRVYHVQSGGRDYLLKSYFRHAKDTRDRLASEYSFLTYAGAAGIDAVPKIYGCDREAGFGLYEFVRGRKIAPDELQDGHVRAALEFFQELNRHRDMEQGRALEVASEACFSLAEHLETVDRRVNRLTDPAFLEAEADGTQDREARTFVRERLVPRWRELKASLEERAAANPRLSDDLPAADRCISPSDFGFHNALLTEEGRVVFLDFEYAGLDDPAKMVGDFFSQPEVMIPDTCYPWFSEAVASGMSRPELERERFRMLLPVYRLKWCCIILNVFLRVDASRRNFADGNQDFEQVKERQLAKAARALDRVVEPEPAA